MRKKQFRVEIFKEFINSWKFKILIAMSFIITFFVMTNYGLNKSYSVAMLTVLTSNIYLVCGLFLPLLVTTINIYNIFNDNHFLSIRIKSKKEKTKELLKNIFYSNSLMFLIVILILLVGLNLMCASNLEFMNSYQFYNIPNIIYIIFYIIRLYVILMIVSLFNGFMLSKISPKLVIFLNVVFYGIMFIYPYAPITEGRTSILDTSPLIFEYLNLNSYSTFITEILCSIFSLLLPILLLKIILNLNFKKNNINSFKYLILNDISYTVNTKKTLLIFYFAYLIIYSLVKIFVMKYDDIGFNVVLGLQADINQNFLNVISFFINSLLFILIGVMLVVKDLSKNKSNIFLRINKTKWIILKVISIIIQFSCLLALGYLTTFVIFALFDSVPSNVITLYFTNLIVFLSLTLITLIMIYGNIIFKLLIALGLILLIYFNHICISNIVTFIPYLIIALIALIIFSVLFFKKKIYKMFESEVLK